ncbi:MAG: hypothetical protein DRJ02_05040 [Bacteroidetes bacterium]|nr:MAG: hypothetical protein DRI87_01270 [Bacteroidota bacterium]RLD87995.1 MAG: hypothetical protein DRJ02_05040 [Bacteroidota bacterium]
MKHITVYFLFFCLVSNHLYSQDTLTVYYDENWLEISDSEDATYYRTACQNNEKLWVVNDYYKAGNTIQMVGLYKTNDFLIKTGHYTYYYENGRKQSEGMFEKGKKNGEWNYWYENGNQRLKEVYKKGQLLSFISYFQNGVKQFEGKVTTHGRKDGKWTFWNSDGRITLTGNYKNDIQVGEWIRYFPDGEMKFNYKNGFVEDIQFGGIVRRN